MAATDDASTHECPTCGDGFGSARGVKAHHQHHEKTYYEASIEQEYGVPAEWLIPTLYHTLDRPVTEISEQLGMSVCSIEGMRDRYGVETKDHRNGNYFPCANCGEGKWVPESRQDRANRFFCDRDCQREWEAGRYVEVECAVCGDVEEVHHSREDSYRYCSLGCHGEWLSENRTGENHPNWAESVKLECEWCGDTHDRLPHEAHRRFCSQDCTYRWASGRMSGRQSEYVEVECEWCGSVDEHPPSIAAVRRFCGQECKYDWLSEKHTGKSHPNWSQQAVECEYCGSERLLPKSRAERSEMHFCTDADCHAKWKSENVVGESHPMWKEPVEVECHWCGSVEERKPSAAEFGERSFCSPECDAAWRREAYSGQNHWGWKGGVNLRRGIVSLLPRPWSVASRTAREQQGGRCVICGVEEETQRRALDVHHIVPILSGGTNGDWNLTALCGDCHRRAEAYTRGIFGNPYTDWADDERPDGRMSSREALAHYGSPRGQTELAEFAD